MDWYGKYVRNMFDIEIFIKIGPNKFHETDSPQLFPTKLGNPQRGRRRPGRK